MRVHDHVPPYCSAGLMIGQAQGRTIWRDVFRSLGDLFEVRGGPPEHAYFDRIALARIGTPDGRP